MDNQKLIQLLDNLVGKRFEYQGQYYNCIVWRDMKEVNRVQIVTNNEVFPMAYADVQSFFREIKIDGEELPFLPPMVQQMWDRHNTEATQATNILLNIMKELDNPKGASQGTLERAKVAVQAATAITNQHKAQTSGIAEVGKLFKESKKSKKQIGDNSANSDEEKPEE